MHAAPSSTWPSPQSKPKKGWSTWGTGTKVLVVLGVLLGSMIALLVIASAFGYWWLFFSVGDQVPGRVVVRPETRAMISMHAEASDPGVAELIGLLEQHMKDMQKKQNDALPEPFRTMSKINSSSDARVRMFWPNEVMIAFTPTGDDGDALELAGAANFSAMGGLIQMMVKMMAFLMESASEKAREERGVEELPRDPAPVEHRGHKIFAGPEFSVTTSGSTLLGAGNLDLMKKTLDYIEDGPEEYPLPDSLRGFSERMEQGADIHGVALDVQTLSTLLESDVLEGIDTSSLGKVGFGADLVTGDELRGQIVVEVSSGAVAPVDAALELLAQQWAESASREGLTLITERASTTNESRLRFRLSGLTAVAKRGFEKVFAESDDGDTE